MSKNTSSDKFRKVNVDVYDEDNYEDDAPSSELTADAVSAKESAVREQLNTQSKPEALRAALKDAPLGAAPGALVARVDKAVMDALSAFKSDEVKKSVGSLTDDEKDLCMKYVYKLMATPQENSSAILLVWHGALVESAGVGCIVRVLTDRAQV